VVLGPTVTAAYVRARTMTVPPQASRDVEGVRSLEVRWIFPGQLTAATAGWFGRFPAQTVTLDDAYLVDPHLPGLSVKVRERRALEVKVFHGSPGLLEVPGRARGRLESWRKWSFPCDPANQESGDPAGWRMVHKRRRISRFSRVRRAAMAHLPDAASKPGCAVELAEFYALGEDWWTLGFEATGPANGLRGQLEAAATVVFSQSLPGGLELGMGNSMSYARWLRGQCQSRR
jgi:hypothetical protein